MIDSFRTQLFLFLRNRVRFAFVPLLRPESVKALRLFSQLVERSRERFRGGIKEAERIVEDPSSGVPFGWISSITYTDTADFSTELKSISHYSRIPNVILYLREKTKYIYSRLKGFASSNNPIAYPVKNYLQAVHWLGQYTASSHDTSESISLSDVFDVDKIENSNVKSSLYSLSTQWSSPRHDRISNSFHAFYSSLLYIYLLYFIFSHPYRQSMYIRKLCSWVW